jgi:hypothetical protein
MVQLVQQELSELSYYAAAGRVALGVAPASSLTAFRSSEVSMGSVGGTPPAAAAAAAGEEFGGALPPGVQVTHGAVLLSDGRLQLSDGRVMETKSGGEVDAKVAAAVQAIRALSESSSDEGLAADPVAVANAEEPTDGSSAEVETVAVPAEGEQMEGPQAADASKPEVIAELQQDEAAAAAAITETHELSAGNA